MAAQHEDQGARGHTRRASHVPDHGATSEVGSHSAEGAAAQSTATPIWEWIVALIGVVCVLGVIGLLGYEALYSERSLPAIAVHVETIAPTHGGYLVQIRVQNEGGTTAAEVTVEGTLTQGGEEIETSAVTLDYVPAHSERRAGLYFTTDPRQGALTLRATGYRTPS
jgi:uncharacterized protein (TIGR02588 family)